MDMGTLSPTWGEDRYYLEGVVGNPFDYPLKKSTSPSARCYRTSARFQLRVKGSKNRTLPYYIYYEGLRNE